MAAQKQPQNRRSRNSVMAHFDIIGNPRTKSKEKISRRQDFSSPKSKSGVRKLVDGASPRRCGDASLPPD
jgi:hypothetical protein